MRKFKSIIALSLLSVFLNACSSGDSQEQPSNTLKKTERTSGAFDEIKKTESSNTPDAIETLDLSNKMTIKLTPFVPQLEGIAESGVKLLKDRLNAAITKIGFGGEGSNPRFIIGPSINIVSQNVTSTAPTKYANTYEINFMVVDVISETVFNNYTSEFKGVGDSPEKAFISGIRNVDFKNQQFMDFLLTSEKKIVEYFENNCESLLSEADTEAGMRNFDNAFAILKSVPTESKKCFSEIQTKKLEYFQASLNVACNELLLKMKSELGKFNDPSASGFNSEAMNYYSMIDSKSECYAEAQTEYKKYTSNLKPEAKRDWQKKMKEYNDQIAMVKADKEFEREGAQQAFDFKVKMSEIEAKRHVEGNQKLLAKYKHDESPWLIRLFSSGSKLFKGEMNTD
ncbi:MAG: hypothetical protein ACI9O4_002072 [Chitinophagales bacterium]|jgi:hypothetical protein|tara:strand:- start:10487 stop:11680 length:1194 start_codon:yes stop_codon:yes gene_type:complete